MKQSIPFIEAVRSGVVETVHRASIIAVDDKNVIYSRGNPDVIVPMRSTSKPFMLGPLLNAAKNCGLYLSNAQICIMLSSHNGETIHRNCVQSILKLAECSTSDLNCGTHIPFFSWLYDDYFSTNELCERQLFHNCSGKHAGMLLLCKLLEICPKEYWLPNHKIQELITSSIKENLHISTSEYFSMITDGCGVPTYAITLKKLAEAYQRFSSTNTFNDMCTAILAEPYMIAGKDRIDTIITEELGFIAKSGSDGLFCIGCPQQKIGIALKIESGSDDAAESAIVEVLDQLGLLSNRAKQKLDEFRFLRIYTSTGEISGNYKPIR